jgi:hypothetical protein
MREGDTFTGAAMPDSTNLTEITTTDKLSRDVRLKLDERLIKLYVELRKSPHPETIAKFESALNDEFGEEGLSITARGYLDRGVEALQVMFGLLTGLPAGKA